MSSKKLLVEIKNRYVNEPDILEEMCLAKKITLSEANKINPTFILEELVKSEYGFSNIFSRGIGGLVEDILEVTAEDAEKEFDLDTINNNKHIPLKHKYTDENGKFDFNKAIKYIDDINAVKDKYNELSQESSITNEKTFGVYHKKYMWLKNEMRAVIHSFYKDVVMKELRNKVKLLSIEPNAKLSKSFGSKKKHLGEKKYNGILTVALYLYPATNFHKSWTKAFQQIDMCRGMSKECIASCLMYAGNVAALSTKKDSRLSRTMWYLVNNPEAFNFKKLGKTTWQLFPKPEYINKDVSGNDIDYNSDEYKIIIQSFDPETKPTKENWFKTIERDLMYLKEFANKYNLALEIRMNGTSDISFHAELKQYVNYNVLKGLKFYDYTKIKDYIDDWKAGKLNSDIYDTNYSLSFSGNNMKAVKEHLDSGGNVAMVFESLTLDIMKELARPVKDSVSEKIFTSMSLTGMDIDLLNTAKKIIIDNNLKLNDYFRFHSKGLPFYFFGYTVIDGDSDDSRSNDDDGVIVGLSSKGFLGNRLIKAKRMADAANNVSIPVRNFILRQLEFFVHDYTIFEKNYSGPDILTVFKDVILSKGINKVKPDFGDDRTKDPTYMRRVGNAKISVVDDKDADDMTEEDIKKLIYDILNEYKLV